MTISEVRLPGATQGFKPERKEAITGKYCRVVSWCHYISTLISAAPFLVQFVLLWARQKASSLVMHHRVLKVCAVFRHPAYSIIPQHSSRHPPYWQTVLTTPPAESTIQISYTRSPSSSASADLSLLASSERSCNYTFRSYYDHQQTPVVQKWSDWILAIGLDLRVVIIKKKKKKH